MHWEGADDMSQAAGLVQAMGRGDVSGPGLLHHRVPRRGRDMPGTVSSPERRQPLPQLLRARRHGPSSLVIYLLGARCDTYPLLP